MKKCFTRLLLGWLAISAPLQPLTLCAQTAAPTTATKPAEPKPSTQALVDPRDIVFEQLKKNCDDLSQCVDKVEHQLRSEEFIEQHITIAELNELIERVKEDLTTRFDQLTRGDKAEIIKIIKAKELVLLKHLNDMGHLSNPDLFKEDKPMSTKKIVLTVCGVATIAIAALLLLVASYDAQADAWASPSYDHLSTNIGTLFGRTKPVIPTPAPAPTPATLPIPTAPTLAPTPPTTPAAVPPALPIVAPTPMAPPLPPMGTTPPATATPTIVVPTPAVPTASPTAGSTTASTAKPPRAFYNPMRWVRGKDR